MRVATLFALDIDPPVAAFDLGRDTASGNLQTQDVDAALIFGGDGTLNRYLPELIEKQIPFVIVPCGSGNDFARELGIRTHADAVRAWEAFRKGECHYTKPVDAVQVRFPSGVTRLYCNIAGIGLDSATNNVANKQPRWIRKRGGYNLAALQALATFEAPTVSLTLTLPDNKRLEIERRMTLAAFANGRSYGSGMRIAPNADFGNGLLEVCLIAHASRPRILHLFPRVFSAKHVGLPEVEFLQARSAEVRAKPAQDVYGDGELLGRTPFSLRVLPGALSAITPPPTTQV
jgi:diacylglycerol kinase (ATP)